MALSVHDGRPMRRNGGDIAVLQVNHTPGMRQQGQRVRSDKRLALAQSEHHRAGVAQTGCNQRLGLPSAHHQDGARPLQPGKCQAHSLPQRTRPVLVTL